MCFAAWKSTDWRGKALRWEDLSWEQKRGLTEAKVLGWKGVGPERAWKAEEAGLGMGWGPLAPTWVNSDHPQLQEGP